MLTRRPLPTEGLDSTAFAHGGAARPALHLSGRPASPVHDGGRGSGLDPRTIAMATGKDTAPAPADDDGEHDDASKAPRPDDQPLPDTTDERGMPVDNPSG